MLLKFIQISDAPAKMGQQTENATTLPRFMILWLIKQFVKI